MWLFRGAQSAVFYYMTCTPCAEHHDRKRRKRSAARGFRDPIPLTEDGAATDQQPVFHQPFPFSTNIYWEEEITLGPGPPARRKNGKANNQRSLDKHKQQQRLRYEMSHPSDYSAQSKHSKGKAKQSQETAENASQDNAAQSQNDRWNWKRYQREDEVLWGKEKKQKRSKGKHAGGDDDHDDDDNDEMGPTYFIARNPEVNDLHPPVVSGPKTRSDTRWMLQPPPCADVMAGKVRCDQEDSGRVSRQSTSQVKNTLTKPKSQPGKDLLRASPAEKAAVLRMLNMNENVAPGTPTPELPPPQETATANNNNASKTSHARPQTSSSRYEDAVLPPPVTPQPAPKSAKSNRQQLTLDIPSSDEDFSDADDATFSAASLSPIEGSPRSPHPQFQPLVGSPIDDKSRHQPSREFFDHFESFDSFNARSNAPAPRLNSAMSPTSTHSNAYTNPYASFFAQSMLKSLHAHKNSSGSTEERKLTADSGKAFPAMAPSKDYFPPLTGATATNRTSEAGATNHTNEKDFGGFQLHLGHMSSQKTVAENDLLTTPKHAGPLDIHIEDTARQLRWSMDI